jgi:hypothetical protein
MMKGSSPGQEPPAKKLKIDYTQDVNLLVGSKETKFIVHKHVLCETSTFFQTALNGQWSEAQSKTIRLEEVGSTSFQTYVH